MTHHVKNELRDIDKGFAQLRKTLFKLTRGESYVKAGVLGGSRVEGDISNVALALIHEYGAPAAGIPERSFLRSTFDAKKELFVRTFNKLLEKVLHGKMELIDAMSLVGEQMAAEIKKRVTVGSQIGPPLQPATIAAKGSSRPLVDTKQLINSVSYEVVK